MTSTWAGGLVWANVFGTTCLAGIDLDTGAVTDVVDARAAGERHADPQMVMNGIAALDQPGEFLLTGKGWRSIRHVRLIPDRNRGQVERLLAGARALISGLSAGAERAGGVVAVGEARAALEDVPRAEVAGHQPGHSRRGEVERQHEQAAAPGVLGGVPCLVPEQGGISLKGSRCVIITFPSVKAGADGTGRR